MTLTNRSRRRVRRPIRSTFGATVVRTALQAGRDARVGYTDSLHAGRDAATVTVGAAGLANAHWHLVFERAYSRGLSGQPHRA